MFSKSAVRLRASYTVLIVATVCALISGCTERTVLHGSGKPTRQVTGSVLSEKQIRVWFVRPQGESLNLVPVFRQSRPGDRLEIALEELLRGPDGVETDSGLATEIPRGTILLAVKPKGEDVEIDLSRRFSSGGGSSSMETRLEQVRKTVDEVCGPKKVYLKVEGQLLTATSGEGLEVKQPIN